MESLPNLPVFFISNRSAIVVLRCVRRLIVVRTLDLADSVRKGNESFPDALHVIRLVQRDLGNSAVISALRSVSLLLLYDYFSESIPANFNA